MPPLVKTISEALASEQRGYRLARALDRRPRLLSMMMDGRGIAKMLAEIGLHGRKDLGQHRRGGVIVEIDAAHNIFLFYASRVRSQAW